MNPLVRTGLVGFTVLCLPLLVANPALATETKLGSGLKFQSDDKSFAAQIGGRIMQDWAFIKADDDARGQLGQSSVDGTEIRRARLFMKGLLYGNVAFKAQYDFAGGGAKTKDLYIELQGLPFGAVRVGNQYEPFGLEENMSSKYITMMERGLTTTFSPGRNMGILAHDQFSDGRGVWAAGVFRVDPADGTAKGTGFASYVQTARVAFAPRLSDDGTKVIHIGAAATHRRPPGGTVSYSIRPEAHLAGKPLHTDAIAVERVVGVDLEAAMISGPFSIQGEFALMAHTAPDSDGEGLLGTKDDEIEPTFLAVSGEISYWLTGEHRSYSKGNFGRVKPRKNYGNGDGKGAWQVAARASFIDLDDGGVEAGTMTDVTLGANWHLNPNTRVMFNYVLAMPEVGDAEGAFNIIQTRFQVDF